VYDFDHLVHFWNPQSPYIDQRYEIQFSVFLPTCYSRYAAKHLLIDPQKNIEGYSILFQFDNATPHNSWLSSEKIELAKVKRMPHPTDGPDQAEHQVTSFSLVI
jgi:hypothetical protein